MPTNVSAQGHVWNRFDDQSAILKLRLAAGEAEAKFAERRRRLRKANSRNPFEVARRLHITIAKEWTERVYGVYTEIWESQGRTKTPEFLTRVFEQALLPAIESCLTLHDGEIIAPLGRKPWSKRFRLLEASLATEAERLKGKWQARIDAEIRKLQAAP